MKKIIYCILILSLIACATNTKRDFPSETEEKPVRIANDSLEYEIIIMDIGFNTFLNSQTQPRGYFSLNFLETKNTIWVNSYNIRANNPTVFGSLYGPSIDYEPHIKYGYEVNYLLYNYFLFFQRKYRQRL